MSSRAEVYLEFGLTPAQYHGQLDRLWKALGATKGPNGEDVFTLAIQAIEQMRCKVSSIPGLEYLEKEGWEIVRYDFANPGEPYLGHDGTVWEWDGLGPSAAKQIIIRKIPKPKQYRAFENAAEFKPHRDRWWMFKVDTRNYCRPPQEYDDRLYGSLEWDEMFDIATFDDGTPFGVEVTS